MIVQHLVAHDAQRALDVQRARVPQRLEEVRQHVVRRFRADDVALLRRLRPRRFLLRGLVALRYHRSRRGKTDVSQSPRAGMRLVDTIPTCQNVRFTPRERTRKNARLA